MNGLMSFNLNTHSTNYFYKSNIISNWANLVSSKNLDMSLSSLYAKLVTISKNWSKSSFDCDSRPWARMELFLFWVMFLIFDLAVFKILRP